MEHTTSRRAPRTRQWTVLHLGTGQWTALLLGIASLAVNAAWASATTGKSTDQPTARTAQEPTLLGSLSPSSPQTFRIRPDVLALSGDGTAFVGGQGWKADGRRVSSFGRIKWTSFGGATASGRGLMWLNDCKPSCAGGRFQHYPAKIQANSIQRHHYTTLIVSFRAAGKSTTGKYTLLSAGSNSYWQLSN